MNKSLYNKYKEYIDYKYLKESYKELSYIYSCIDKMFLDVPNVEQFSVQDLQAFFFIVYPDADKETYMSLFKRLQEEAVDIAVGDALLSQIKRRKDALTLSESLFKVSQGHAVDDLTEKLSVFEQDDHSLEPAVEVVSNDLELLIHETYQEQGFRWRLNCLNKSLGSLRKGDFGFIFARPETGKTTFLASETSNFLHQDEAKIIWFNLGPV